MLAVRAALDELTLEKDGVDGKSDLPLRRGLELRRGRRQRAVRAGHAGPARRHRHRHVLRPAARRRPRRRPVRREPARSRASAPGCSPTRTATPGNGTPEEQAARLAHATDLVQLGLAGNLRDLHVPRARHRRGRRAATRSTTTASPPGTPTSRTRSITLRRRPRQRDAVGRADVQAAAVPTPMADRIRMNTLSLATTALSQTPSFWHAGRRPAAQQVAGPQQLRLRRLVQPLDWTGADNGFGHGLPPAPDNEAKWPFQQPLLADPALKPTAAEVARRLGAGAGPAAAALLARRCSGSATADADPAEGVVPDLRAAAARARV